MSLVGLNTAEAGDLGCRKIPVLAAECFKAGETAHCQGRQVVAPSCFDVHGRLEFANGSPTVRLWPIGSRRLFGVFGGDGDPDSPTLLPLVVRTAATPSTPGSMLAVVGDFRVCPLASERRGWMQPVCIEGAAHVVASSRQDDVTRRSPP